MFSFGLLFVFVTAFVSSNGHPIDPKVALTVTNGFGITIIGGALLITTVFALIACACCKQRRDGFKEFRNPPSTSHTSFTNNLTSELAIFPPAVNVQQQPPTSSVEDPPQIEAQPPSRPAAFSCAVPSVTDWFIDPNSNFPRQQLFYQKEIGKGWFGKVVKGEARGAKVVVRILREDATPEEKGYFLHEAKPFRDLKHKNISRLYGRCLEHDPYLLLFEYCTNGDLKSFLVTNSGSRNAITEQKISLKMMIDVTEGLKYMNEHGFIHTDLAARNCLVSSDLTVKIGDYGTSVDKYKNEYYIVGDVAVPIRWCAPESLICTQTTMETKEVTEGGNVWSLAVLLWEIAEFGKLPYQELADDEVITKVLVQGSLRLPPPNCSFGHYLHNIMNLCWRMGNRANVEQVLSMLIYLKSNPFQESDFEARWKNLKPNTVAVVDNHTPIHSPRHTELAQRPRLTAKHEFDSGVDLEIKPTDENPDSCRTSTPNTVSPQLSVTSEEIFQPASHKSPSMTNLKGSLEDVTQYDSWLMGVEQKTEEDRNFVKNISEAIKNLDETLALEKTSSSSQDSSMESSKKPLLDFKLGPTGGEKKGDSSSSDTEEETWRNRIERGEFTEKVKEKSKSVTDLMVLTHIDSEGSESDSLPSLTRQYSLKKTTIKGVSYTGVGFGSEGNIRNAVLSEELQDKFKQLTSWKTDTQSFLVKGASEKNNTNLLIVGDIIKSKQSSSSNIKTPEKSESDTEKEEIVSNSVTLAECEVISDYSSDLKKDPTIESVNLEEKKTISMPENLKKKYEKINDTQISIPLNEMSNKPELVDHTALQNDSIKSLILPQKNNFSSVPILSDDVEKPLFSESKNKSISFDSNGLKFENHELTESNQTPLSSEFNVISKSSKVVDSLSEASAPLETDHMKSANIFPALSDYGPVAVNEVNFESAFPKSNGVIASKIVSKKSDSLMDDINNPTSLVSKDVGTFNPPVLMNDLKSTDNLVSTGVSILKLNDTANSESRDSDVTKFSVCNPVQSDVLNDPCSTYEFSTTVQLLKGHSPSVTTSVSSNDMIPVILKEYVESSPLMIISNSNSTPESNSSVTMPVKELPALSHSIINLNANIENDDVYNASVPVNKESVIFEEFNVNSNCTKEEESNVLSSAGNTFEKLQSCGTFNSVLVEDQLASSHSENPVPKIVITESSETSQSPPEPESDIDTQYLVKIKPRKFVFVCRDIDPVPNEEVIDNRILGISEKKIIDNDTKKSESHPDSSSSVILGSCEEHTLDFFKGLKTTFTPNVSYVVENESRQAPAEYDWESGDEHSVKEEGNFVSQDYSDRQSLTTLGELNMSSDNIKNLPGLVEKDNLNDNHNGISDLMVEKHSDKSLTFPQVFLKGYDKSLMHIIDTFINNERSYLAPKNIINKVECEKIPSSQGIIPDKTECENISRGIEFFSKDESSALKNVNIKSSSKIDGSLSSANCSEEHLVEAPYPFNQPEPADKHSTMVNVKAKSLDSFLSPKNGFEHLATLRNGIYAEDDNLLTNFVPVFNMTESVSENAFMSKNLYYDPYFSVDSGHSSDRCIEQDKKMNDLKNRLEDVVKSGSDFQLKSSEDEYGGKLLTPDDERSSDSGFRDKGSLSESVEDTCDEKYNLEDIDAELDEYGVKNLDKEDLKYYEQFVEPDQEISSGWFLHPRVIEGIGDENKESGWISQSTEYEERLPLTIDAEFAAAIRNELKEKLPCGQKIDKVEEDSSPEQEFTTEKFTYPSQLSPILEEQESNQSSLQLNDSSPVFVLPPPEMKNETFEEDIRKAYESLELSKNVVIIEDLEDDGQVMVYNEDKIVVDDDVLIVDTETNEATLIESPKPQAHLAFILTKNDPGVNDGYSPELNSEIYALTPDNAPLTPNSVDTNSHSSPENANMSGLFLSPCSIRSDLFDSGPPSLPFDLGQSLEEVEEIPVSEETIVENPVSEMKDNSIICNGLILDNILEDNLKDRNIKTEKAEDNLIEIEHNEEEKGFMEKPEKGVNGFKLKDQYNDNCDIEVSLNPSDPANSNIMQNFLSENTFEPKHIKAEVEIDKLLFNSNKQSEVDKTNQLNSNSVLRNDWLKDLFTNNLYCVEEVSNKDDKNIINGNLPKNDWPTIEELIFEKSEENNCLKPNVTSTLALMSPDLSSTDSKSLVSSFSSTPSSDENKTVAMGSEEIRRPADKISKPNTLSFRQDASGAPMPSPEDAEKGWRPTICQLMELTDQAAAEGEEMTTSFIEPDENGIYTPDWESDISEEQSSSSGEFVWKEGEKEELVNSVATDTNSLNEDLMGRIGMERIEEVDEDGSTCSDDSDSNSDTSSCSTEFAPSTWNAMAVPTKSSLRVNHIQKKDEKKKVKFKKEKYQCVYEYPREESDNEEDEELSPGLGMWQTTTAPVFDCSVFDYSVFADLELSEGMMSTPDGTEGEEAEENKNLKKEETVIDYYALDYPVSSVDRPWNENLPEDEADFSPLASDLAPVRLGDLRHTKATLRLDLPQLRPDQGEASILDTLSDSPIQ